MEDQLRPKIGGRQIYYKIIKFNHAQILAWFCRLFTILKILFYNQILFQNIIFIYSDYWTTWASTGALMIIHCGQFHRLHDWYCIWWQTCWFESAWLTFKGVHILLDMAETQGGILLWHERQVWDGIPSRWLFRPESNEQQQQHRCEWWRQRKEEIRSILRWYNPQQ